MTVVAHYSLPPTPESDLVAPVDVVRLGHDTDITAEDAQRALSLMARDYATTFEGYSLSAAPFGTFDAFFKPHSTRSVADQRSRMEREIADGSDFWVVINGHTGYFDALAKVSPSKTVWGNLLARVGLDAPRAQIDTLVSRYHNRGNGRMALHAALKHNSFDAQAPVDVDTLLMSKAGRAWLERLGFAAVVPPLATKTTREASETDAFLLRRVRMSTKPTNTSLSQVVELLESRSTWVKDELISPDAQPAQPMRPNTLTHEQISGS